MGEVNAKCPKCGGRSFTLFERLEMAHVFRVEAGKALPMQRDDSLPAQLGFSATCDFCGHHWTPRYRTGLLIMEAERPE